jgi:hypothetical protein
MTDLILEMVSGFRVTIRLRVHIFTKPFEQNIATEFSNLDVTTANSEIYYHRDSIVQRLVLE